MLSEPIITAPASRRRLTLSASCSAIRSRNASIPLDHGKPATAIFAFTPMVTPSSGPWRDCAAVSKSVKAFRGSFAAFRSSQWIMAGSKPPCVNQPDRLLTGIDLGIVSSITRSDESNIDLDANALAEQFRNLALLTGTAAFQRDVQIGRATSELQS